MGYTLIHGNVEDFGRWKKTFDEVASLRGENGSKGGYIFQSTEDPNEVIVLLEFDDLQRARELYGSDQMREVMQRAGVVGRPHFHYVELVDRPAL